MHALRERADVNGVAAEVIDAAELRRREPHVAGLGALWLPGTGITDYRRSPAPSPPTCAAPGARSSPAARSAGIEESGDEVRLTTGTGVVRARHVVFCAGVQADRVARLAGLPVDFAIVPFRGEYYDVVPERADLVRSLIYPIPDPSLPFLGVHLTPTVDGGLNVGPNAVLGLAREGYPKFSFGWRDTAELARFRGMYPLARQNVRTGARELRNSLWQAGYLRECQKYVPGLTLDDLVPARGGHPRPGRAARRLVRPRLPAAAYGAHPARGQRAVPGGHLGAADRPGAGPDGPHRRGPRRGLTGGAPRPTRARPAGKPRLARVPRPAGPPTERNAAP